ncbi:hypothetical protein D3C84_592370 [compost metagenome]
MTVKDQPASDGRQVGTGLVDAVGVYARREQLAKRIGGGVLGIRVIAQPSLNMLQQPTVMIAEKITQLAGRRRLHRIHFQMLVRVVLNNSRVTTSTAISGYACCCGKDISCDPCFQGVSFSGQKFSRQTVTDPPISS